MTAQLEFIIGRAGAGKTHACLTAMAEALTREPLGRQRILLVPEHMTYAAERALAESLTDGAGFLQAYVFGFRRLARQVLLETGGAHLPRISDIGRRILLKDILLKHERSYKKKHDGQTSVFSRSVHKRGFTESLGSTIAELKRYRLSPDVLRTAAQDVGTSGRLPQKLTELADVMDEFAARMEGRLSDHTDRMERLAQQLVDAPFLCGAEIWVDGFDFFNPQELAVFRALFQTAARIHVSLTMDGHSAGCGVSLNVPENVSDIGLFARSYQTMHNLLQILAEADPTAGHTVTFLEGQRRTARESLGSIEKYLFGHSSIRPAEDGALQLVEAANPRLEVEAVAADVLRLVREKHYRYREIAVLVRDMERYADLLTLTFADFGIPCYMDAKRPSTHHPLAELLRAAAQIVWRGWGYENVFRALRTGFFPVLAEMSNDAAEDVFADDWQEAVDRLENYCLAYGIRTQRQWTATEAWDYVRCAVDDERCSAQDAARIAEETALDAMRRRIAAPLSLLTQNLRRKGSSARARTEALYDFLDRLLVAQTLDEWSTAADTEGRLSDAAIHRQMWASCMTLLDQLVEVSGAEEISERDYEEFLSDGLDALSISLIPPGLDHVTIASFDQNSLAGVRASYILGANAGTMPRARVPQGILSDADHFSINESFRAQDTDAMHTIFGGSKEQSFMERYQLYRGFTEASEYLWVSYALSTADGSALTASPLVARLRLLNPAFFSIPLASVERRDPLVLAAPRPALSSLAGALLAKKERGEMAPLWGDVYNWMRTNAAMHPHLRRMIDGLFAPLREERISARIAQRLFARERCMSGSTTRLETFRQCPFRHFAMYGLGLRARERYEFQSSDFGTLLHGILRGYGEWVRDTHANDWGAAEPKSAEKIDELLKKMMPQVRSDVLMSRASYRHRIERIRRTAEQVIHNLTQWAQNSDFHPHGFELSFGRNGDAVPLLEFSLADGMILALRGQIDRLDVTADGAYYLVLDYKTGVPTLLLPEIRYGLKMQLLLYLYVIRSLLSKTNGFPAGMLYAPVVNPVIKTDVRMDAETLTAKVREKMELTGIFLDDAEILRQIDALAAHISISFNKDQSISKKSANYIHSREEFEQLLAFLPQLIRETAEEILHGNIRVAPYRFKDRNACTYCDYRAVCAFDPDLGRGDAYHDIADDAQAAMAEIAEMVRGEVTPNDL